MFGFRRRSSVLKQNRADRESWPRFLETMRVASGGKFLRDQEAPTA